MHGMTKMQEYMMLFERGINFYGGPGESAHKQFIKIPGQRTQQRVNEFAQQTALQYYNMIVSGYAAHDCQIKSNLYKQSGNFETKRRHCCWNVRKEWFQSYSWIDWNDGGRKQSSC